jgi:hypothetical protein
MWDRGVASATECICIHVCSETAEKRSVVLGYLFTPIPSLHTAIERKREHRNRLISKFQFKQVMPASDGSDDSLGYYCCNLLE